MWTDLLPLMTYCFVMSSTPGPNNGMLAAGRWCKHRDRLNTKLLKAHQVSARQLTQAGLVLDHPGEGGLFLWVSVPEDAHLNLLVQAAYGNKILLVRGATFSADNPTDAHIRFNVAFS